MRSYTIRNLALPGVLAALAVALTLVYVARAGTTGSTPAAAGAAAVYVATRDVAAGTPGADVARTMKLVRVPAGTVVPMAITRASDLMGRVAVAPVYRGEQITLRRFAGVQQQGIAGQLSGRLRALQIAGDANQVLAGTLRDGDRVDVVASLKTPTGQRPYGRTVLRNALVLRAPSGSASPGGGTSSYSATLRVTDAQAQTLFFVIKNGDWSFVLRPVVHARNGGDAVDSVESVLRGRR